jgi:hypothetical protein
VRALCRFLGEDFEPAMLDTGHAPRTVNRIREVWKSKVTESLDRSRVEVWRRELDPERVLEAEALLGDRLRRYGYPHEERETRYLRTYPDRLVPRFPESVMWAARHGFRLWPQHPAEEPAALLFLGHPSCAAWFPTSRSKRVRRMGALLGALVRTASAGKDRFWWPDASVASGTGLCAAITAAILGRAARKLSP